jgi:hypothetical protein
MNTKMSYQCAVYGCNNDYDEHTILYIITLIVSKNMTV